MGYLVVRACIRWVVLQSGSVLDGLSYNQGLYQMGCLDVKACVLHAGCVSGTVGVTSPQAASAHHKEHCQDQLLQG